MASFVSTTTPAYTDTNRAFGIKALEKRYADLLASQAKQGGITPENTQTPVQGFGHVVNQLADQLAVNRAEQQGNAARQRLADAIGRGGSAPEDRAVIGVEQPETYRQMLSEQAAKDAAAEAAKVADAAKTREYDFQGGLDHLRRQTEEKIASERNRVTQEEGQYGRENAITLQGGAQAHAAKEAELDRQLKIRENALARLSTTSDIELRGRIEKEIQDLKGQQDILKQQAADTAKLNSPEYVKERAKFENEYVSGHRRIDKMQKARGLLDAPGGVDVGRFANLRTEAALASSGLVGNDLQMAKNTLQFNTYMQDEAVQKMVNELVGQSTNFEMQKFAEIVNNPAAPIEQRKTALDAIIKYASVQKDIAGRAASALRSDLPALDKQLAEGSHPSQKEPPPQQAGGGGTTAPPPPGGGGGADPVAEAQAAIDKGAPFDAVSKIAASKGVDVSKLRPKAP